METKTEGFVVSPTSNIKPSLFTKISLSARDGLATCRDIRRSHGSRLGPNKPKLPFHLSDMHEMQ